MTVQLPDMPARIARLPKDHRGYPVPYFAAWTKDGKLCDPGEGEPQIHIADHRKLMLCATKGRCWVCGEQMGRFMTFTIGPMCTVNRTSSEPPAHTECAEWSTRGCPFLTKPRMKRVDPGEMKDKIVSPAGEMIERNPGCTALWTTRQCRVLRTDKGILFKLGEPVTPVLWRAEGRPATLAEVRASMNSGMLILMKMAASEGKDAIAALLKARTDAEKYLPPETDDAQAL